MKKTLLATAIVSALGASAVAQAATVYDQDGTRVDIYGRIAMAIESGGTEYDGGVYEDNGAEFVDASSRLGLRLQHMVSSDLTAFGHLEWRFRADEAGNRNGNDFDAFSETRQAYMGLRSNIWGTLQAGNFDSFYFQAVTKPFDNYVTEGFEFSGHASQSRGDSIGYITPKLNGFQAFLQAKHYSERGEGENSQRDEEIVAQGGVVYETGGLRLAAGFIDDKAVAVRGATSRFDTVSGTGNDEVRYGASAEYQFTPEFSARLGYETRDQNDDYGDNNGWDRAGLGMTYAVNEWTFLADIYDIDPEVGSSQTAWALGAMYDVSSNFDVFVEVFDSDIDVEEAGVQIDKDDVYWAVGARYHF